MPIEVIMPKVDMDMASGKIAAWHVASGEKVEKGERLFDIETDKSAFEVEAPASGILHHPSPEGTDIPIGAAVGWLYGEGEEVGNAPEASSDHGQLEADAQSDESIAGREPSFKRSGTADQPVIPETRAVGRVRATPLARSLSREAGIDLTEIKGSGERGRIQGDDVRAYLKAETPPTATPLSFTPETGALAVTASKAGTGTPIVLIHGFANDSTGWVPVESHFKHRPLYRIDLPCHGRSPKRVFREFSDVVADVRETFDALDTDSVHIIAHSLGGALAIALTDTRAHKIASLTLIAPAGLGPQINGDALQGILRATRPESLAPWLKLLVADETLITGTYARMAMASRNDPALRAAQTRLAQILFPDGTQSFSVKAALGRIDVPTRIIWGRRDSIIPWKHALEAPGRMALHLFKELGHMLHIEAPDRIGILLNQYL